MRNDKKGFYNDPLINDALDTFKAELTIKGTHRMSVEGNAFHPDPNIQALLNHLIKPDASHEIPFNGQRDAR